MASMSSDDTSRTCEPRGSDGKPRTTKLHDGSSRQGSTASFDQITKTPTTTVSSCDSYRFSSASNCDEVHLTSAQRAPSGGVYENADSKLMAVDNDDGSSAHKPTGLQKVGRQCASLSSAEWTACILAPLSMVATIVALYHFRDKPVQQWPLVISVNTVLAV